MNKFSNYIRLFLAAVALYFIATTFIEKSHKHPNVPAIKNAQKNSEHLQVKLQTSQGEFKLADFKGHTTLVFFGYMFCPDICPTTLTTTAIALKKMSKEKFGDVKVVFVSVDPERDTPAKLEEYVKFFGSNFIGATSSKENIDTLVKLFFAGFKIQEQANKKIDDKHYFIDHTTYTYVLDKNGEIVDLVNHTNDAEKLQKDLEQIIPEV